MIIELLAASALGTTALEPCDFGKRHADAPQQLEEYSFLIGNHTVRAYRWNAEINDWQGYVETQWNGWWALDGYAIADEWFDPVVPGQPPTGGRGINIRMWDEANDRWSNMWMHSRNSTTTELHSKMEDGKMVMVQVSPEPAQTRRVEFSVHENGDWTRIGYLVSEDGTLVPQGRLDGIKMSCPGE